MRLETLEGLSVTWCELAGPLVSVTRSAVSTWLTFRPLVPQGAPVGVTQAPVGPVDEQEPPSTAAPRALARGLWGRADGYGPCRSLAGPCAPVFLLAPVP